MKIEETLNERGDRYGKFEHHAVIAQKLQDVMRDEAGWSRLAADQKQALTVIADKIARMLNGDPAYRDNWHDIVGYAKLVDDRMAADEAEPSEPAAFTEWCGGDKPPCPKDTVVTVVFRDGEQATSLVRHFVWSHNKSAHGDIVGWRFAGPVHNAPSEPEQPWNDHFGGPMAPFRPGALVQVWLRDAAQPCFGSTDPAGMRWEHQNNGGDIMRWRYAS